MITTMINFHDIVKIEKSISKTRGDVDCPDYDTIRLVATDKNDNQVEITFFTTLLDKLDIENKKEEE